MELTNEKIRERLSEKFGEEMAEWGEPYGMLTFSAPKALNLKVLQFLFDDEELKFRFLTDLQAVHYPDRKGEELCVVYHLHNLADNVRIRFIIFQVDVKTRLILFYQRVLEQEGILFTGSDGELYAPYTLNQLVCFVRGERF